MIYRLLCLWLVVVFCLLLVDGRGAGYSCMTSIDEHTIGIFYEGSQADIQFQAIPLKELLKK